MKPSAYYDSEALSRETQAGRHREAVGGLWEELGQLQLHFLQQHGLQPEHFLLDIGCGALRLGVRALDYLQPGHYFGVDISPELLEAGYIKELSENQRMRLPRANLCANASFDFSFLPHKVDVAIAQSVFTHLPLNHIRRCLACLAPYLSSGGFFFATAWIVPNSHPLEQEYQQKGKIDANPIVSYDVADPYHYHLADFEYAAKGLPYRLSLIGEWSHPRGQLMLSFEKL